MSELSFGTTKRRRLYKADQLNRSQTYTIHNHTHTRNIKPDCKDVCIHTNGHLVVRCTHCTVCVCVCVCARNGFGFPPFGGVFSTFSRLCCAALPIGFCWSICICWMVCFTFFPSVILYIHLKTLCAFKQYKDAHSRARARSVPPAMK